ncbi:hypothetical protein PACTADRAFT_4841 [Pachysolen tannophilus NRRL Y-2460]|uniref:FAD dependent oxidoreductase domain-containing protein n=1 Tax=Pachysolen tannophilus NRRL Y-2460 TaxID=669874 RepID=A0A1E4TQC0_PACTA|nr:hypothetical protein PACTADRAFT_4841 [Pachysolen tannophilus NRRL Y-2460]
MGSEDADFVIVGCGVFGLSTALDLSRRYGGSKKIIALDAFTIPSPWSAANDLNKIIRAEYSDIDYTKLALEALELWEKDPVFKNHFIKCGRVTLSPMDEKNNLNRLNYERKGLQNLIKLGCDPDRIVEIKEKSQFVKIIPELRDTHLFDSEIGFETETKTRIVQCRYNPDAGYGHASNSLISVYNECIKNGVIFKFGQDGKVIDIDKKNVIVITYGGKSYKSYKIILTMGAATGHLINLNNQINSTGLFITHIKLSNKEFEKYEKLPIFFSSELGYFFPPDKNTKMMKIAMTFCDVKNTINNTKTTEQSSLPRYKNEFFSDTFPRIKGLQQVETLLNKIIPELALHKLIDSKCCWISDTIDSNFLIDFLPDSNENILVCCGDSGHGFKFFPNLAIELREIIMK